MLGAQIRIADDTLSCPLPAFLQLFDRGCFAIFQCVCLTQMLQHNPYTLAMPCQDHAFQCDVEKHKHIAIVTVCLVEAHPGGDGEDAANEQRQSF